MSQKFVRVLNIVFFHILWWGCVVGVKYSIPYLGLIITLIFIILHLNIISNSKKEFKLICSSFFFGLFVEYIHLLSGMLSYSGYLYKNDLFIHPPIWIICIWVGFSTTLNHSMSWMKERVILMILCGLFFGPISYLAGSGLGMLQFNYSNQLTLISLALVWGISLPLMYYINHKIYESN